MAAPRTEEEEGSGEGSDWSRPWPGTEEEEVASFELGGWGRFRGVAAVPAEEAGVAGRTEEELQAAVGRRLPLVR